MNNNTLTIGGAGGAGVLAGNTFLSTHTYITGKYSFPYWGVRYPYNLESFSISETLTINIFTLSTTDPHTYVHDKKTLMIFYE